MRALPIMAAVLLNVGTVPALACAVPTQIDLRNATGQQVQHVAIHEEQGGFGAPPRTNILPPAGLAPGASRRVQLPSCIGVYALVATLADGTVRRVPGLDAQRIRALELR